MSFLGSVIYASHLSTTVGHCMCPGAVILLGGSTGGEEFTSCGRKKQLNCPYTFSRSSSVQAPSPITHCAPSEHTGSIKSKEKHPGKLWST